jgi:S1-C subfamily serine protease
MESGGPFTFGDFPDDFGGGEGDPDQPSRGWLPPEDRLWRHPSETGSSPATAGGLERDGEAAPRAGLRRTALAVGLVGVATVATAAGVLTVGGQHTTTATDTSVVTIGSSVAIGPDVAKVVDDVQASLVSLVPAGTKNAELPEATGVVLPGGTLVLTAAAAVVEGEHMTVLTSQGRRCKGVVLGVDDRSGVAVVRVGRRLVSGSFVDGSVSPRQLAVTACRCAPGSSLSAGTVQAPEAGVGMVRTEGSAAVDDGGPTLVDAIEAEVPLGSSAMGTVLLDDDGRVIGILDGERSSGGDTFGYFVPSPLAVGVAVELADLHAITKSWLGVVCQDEATGAAVVSVLPGSPAAQAGIRPGDLVEAVDSRQVSSLADLQAKLYTTPPGTRLVLTVIRSGAVTTMPVTVVAGPS